MYCHIEKISFNKPSIHSRLTIGCMNKKKNDKTLEPSKNDANNENGTNPVNKTTKKQGGSLSLSSYIGVFDPSCK